MYWGPVAFYLSYAWLLSCIPHQAWWPVWGIYSWSQTSSAAEVRSWTGWHVGSVVYTRLRNTYSLPPATDVWGPPRYLETESRSETLRALTLLKSDNCSLKECACICTVDSKDVFDLLLNHFQSHFNPIGISHSMDLIGVKSVDIQDLKRRKKEGISTVWNHVRWYKMSKEI